MRTDIDVTFNFWRDTPKRKGADPDSDSETLRQYHKVLWSKRLPGGEYFELDGKLHHRSALGEFWLSSDAVIPTFKWNKDIRKLIPDEELEAFNAIGYTIGGMMVFPANQIDGKQTINQERGFAREIKDRFDLTLECIRCHYSGGTSPLADVLARYQQFFDLFVNFQGYVEFFLLQDLVSEDFSEVKFSLPFDEFQGSPVPVGVQQYKTYKNASIAFIEARNRRVRSLQVETCTSRV